MNGKIQITTEQKAAINAILAYNNFLLISEGADGKITVCMHATKEMMEAGIKDIGQFPLIKDLLTNVVIDLQTAKK